MAQQIVKDVLRRGGEPRCGARARAFCDALAEAVAAAIEAELRSGGPVDCVRGLRVRERSATRGGQIEDARRSE